MSTPRIAEARKQRKMRQRELARRLGCSHTHLGKIERGVYNATLKDLQRIAAELEVTVGQLLGETLFPWELPGARSDR